MKHAEPNVSTDTFLMTGRLLILVAVLAAGVCACAAAAPVIRGGSELDFRPYAFTDANGQPTGFGPELLRAVADSMGLKLQLTTGPWDRVWADLLAGWLDVLPVVARTPGREPLVDFSLSHTQTFDAFFVRAGRPPIRNLAAAAGKEIVVLRDDAAQHQLEERKFAGKIVPVDSIPEGLRLIAAGKHDALLCSKVVGVLEREQAGIEGVEAGPPIPDYRRDFSFAVSKGNAELLEKLNQGLAVVKANGTYDRLYQRWLGVHAPRYPWLPHLLWVLAGVVVLGVLVVVLQLLVRRRTRQLHELNATLEARAAERTAALQEANKRYELVLAGAQAGIWDWDVPAHRVVYSSRWKEMRGFATGEISDAEAEWSSRIHPEDAPRVRAAVEAHFQGRTPAFDEEYRVQRKDGTWMWVADRGLAHRDANGRVVRMAGSEIDITERKQTEEERAQARRRAEHRAAELEAVLQAVPAAVWIAHDPACRHITGNRTANEWLRLGEGSESSLTAPDGGAPIHFRVRHDGRELQGPELPVQRAATGVEVRDFEQEVVFDDGSVRYLLGNAAPLWDEHGRSRGAVAAFIDIGERKRLELNTRFLDRLHPLLMQEQDRAALVRHVLDSLVEHLGVDSAAFGEVAPDGETLMIRHECRSAGPSGLGTHRPEDFIADATRDAMRAGEGLAVQDVASDPRTAAHAEHFHSFGVAAFAAEPLMSAGAQGLISVASRQPRKWRPDEVQLLRELAVRLHQAMERARAETGLREADRRKDVFLAILAHELRNPLAPIRSAVEILKLKGSPDPVAQAARDIIERQVVHMVRLIDDLLDVSRITRGSLQLRRERVELKTVLEHAVEASRPLTECAGHDFSVELPPDAMYLDADPVRLVQVVSNLLNNACKYTDPGGRICLRAARAGDEVAVQVEDSGIGIPPDQLPHVFDMFAQIPASGEHSQAGLGIGLAHSRALVEMHGGRIEGRSAGRGQGSTFTVWLPLAAGSPPDAAAEMPVEEIREAVPARVLAVDDNEDIVASLALLLRVHGYEVQTARDGLEAVEAAERFRPDLVLLDLGMPGLDGYGACRRLREQFWAKDVTIIALTGWGRDADRHKTAEAGFDGHLIKPVDPTEILRLLAERESNKA